MSSSTTLVLVNKVLRMTGHFKQLAAITGSAGGVGERIVEMLNLAISDIESRANWDELRVNSQGTGDGTSDVFEFNGADDIRADGPVSVWIAGEERVEELTPTQFDEALALNEGAGDVHFFQRGATTAGVVQIQIYPTPASGAIINMSGYKHAIQLDDTAPTAVSEFEDALLVQGAVAHMDAYDNLQRGYGKRFETLLSQKVLSYYSNRTVRMVADSYT